jgi:hypothetical protein
LQIIKRFEKEKEFLTPIWQWAETQLEAEPGPASRSLSSPFLHSRTAHDAAQPTIHSPVRGLLATYSGPNFFFIHVARRGISLVLAATHLGPAAAHRTGVIFLLDTEPKQRRWEEILPHYES